MLEPTPPTLAPAPPEPASAPAPAPAPSPVSVSPPDKKPVVSKKEDSKKEDSKKNILSTNIKKPSFDNFEEGRSEAIQKMNEKYGILLKAEQEILANIEGFNKEMGVLLSLKDVHKQPFDLTGIKLDRVINTDGDPVKTLPTTKPGTGAPVVVSAPSPAPAPAAVAVGPELEPSPPQFFACLRCGSAECNNSHQIMAIYQFGEEDVIIDESFKKEYSDKGLEALDNVARRLGAGGAVGAPAPSPPNSIEHEKVQYITSNYDEAYTENLMEFFGNQNDRYNKSFYENSLLRLYTNIENNKKYNPTATATTAAAAATATAAAAASADDILKEIYNTNVVENKPHLRNFVLYAGTEHDGLRCGCVNHSVNTYEQFGISVTTKGIFKDKCEDTTLISRIGDGSTYRFNPIGENKYEPKTVFFCTHCKHFFRYACLRDINKNQQTGKNEIIRDYNTCSQITELKETLPVISADMLFRTPLFHKSYNDHLEKTARDLKLSFFAKMTGNEQVQLAATSMLGQIVGNVSGIDIDFEKSDWMKKGIGAAYRGIKQGNILQIGGGSLGEQRGGAGEQGCGHLQRDITNLLRGASGPSSPGAGGGPGGGGGAGPGPGGGGGAGPGPGGGGGGGPGAPGAPGAPGGPGGASVGTKQPSTIMGITGASIDFGSQYGKLRLRKTMKEFKKELDNWKVCPDENRLLDDIKQVKTDKTEAKESDKKPFRGKYKSLQDNFISDFESKFGSIKNFFPFIRDDFVVLENLCISGDNEDDKYTDTKLRIWGKTDGYAVMNELNVAIQGGGDNPRIGTTNYARLSDHEARRLRTEHPKGTRVTDETIFKLMCENLTFERVKITAKGNPLLYAKLLQGEAEEQLLGRYGKLSDLVAASRYGSIGHEDFQRLQETLASAAQDSDLNNEYRDGTSLREYIRRHSGSIPYYEYTLVGSKIRERLGDNGNQDRLLPPLDDFEILTKLRVCLGEVGNDSLNISRSLSKYNTFKASLEARESFNKLITGLNDDYKAQGDKLKTEFRTKYKDAEADITDPQFQRIVVEMCGGNSGMFWFGASAPDYKDKYNFKNYQRARSILSRAGILYLPWYDTGFVEAIQGPNIRVAMMEKKNLKGEYPDVTEPHPSRPVNQYLYNDKSGAEDRGLQPADSPGVDQQLSEFKEPSVWDVYRKEVLPLFPLLSDGASVEQFVCDNDREHAKIMGKFRITQLRSANNILKGCHSLGNFKEFKDDDYPTIWVEPKNQDGFGIKTPIQILRLKQRIKDKAEKYYATAESLKYDKATLKRYEEEYKRHLKESGKTSSTSGKDVVSGMDESQTDAGIDIPSEQVETTETVAPVQDVKQVDQVEQDEIRSDKTYTSEDLTKFSNELNELKREKERKQIVLENLAQNIKRLKSQKHGEDSEQRQLQMRDYEYKEKELRLVQQLIEQREEKLKILKILTEKVLEKEEKENKDSLEKDKRDEEINFLKMQEQMMEVTDKYNKDQQDSYGTIKDDEISELQSKVEGFEDDEITLAREGISQNGGGRRKKGDERLREILFKTESRRNRTKKKRGKQRKNDRKNDRSISKHRDRKEDRKKKDRSLRKS